MKLIFLFLSFLLGITTTNAHSANIKGYKVKDSEFISKCNNTYYGYHKQNGQNHWHEVYYNDKEWEIVDSKKHFDSDPCLTEGKIEVALLKCVDGDTAVFKMANDEVKFRFLAVDTPESVHPTKEVEAYAKEASKKTCDLLTNASSIMIEYDSNSDKTDKYGRNLAWIWVDNMLLQELMIGEGFARVAYVYGNYKYLDNLCNLQQQAINNNIGIWQYGYEVGYCENKKTNSNKSLNSNSVFTVTFKDGDSIKEVAVAEGMSVKKIDAKGKFGYKFLGWYYDNQKYDFNSSISDNIVLLARYQIDYIYILVVLLIIVGGLLNINKEGKNGKNNKKSSKRHRKERV